MVLPYIVRTTSGYAPTSSTDTIRRMTYLFALCALVNTILGIHAHVKKK